MSGSSSSTNPNCSNQLSDEEIQYLSLLLGIIDSQNWQAFGYAILNNPRVFQSFARTIQQSNELNGMTILHACVRFDPPPHIVKLLIELVPESPSCVDCLQRTPLHVAAGTRASLSIIKMLAEACPRAVDIQDEDGKTPLHLACDRACELFEGDSRGEDSTTRSGPSYEVVKTLIQASPLSAPLEDQDGMSALEHAIFSDAPIKVVKLLQYVTRKQCEYQKEQEMNEKQTQLDSSFKMTSLTRRVSQDSQDVVPDGVISMSIDAPPSQDKSSAITATVIPACKGEFTPRSRSRRGGISRPMNANLLQQLL